jgi:hypothetical protein
MNEIVTQCTPSTLSFLNMIGPFLSGISLLIAAVIGVVSYIFIHRRAVQTAWIETFRTLYGEFWKDDEITQVRRWITNDEEYKDIKSMLDKRMEGGDNNSMSIEENDKIEKIDRFCSIMMRVKYFGQMEMTDHQRNLYNDTYKNFWVIKISQRSELRKYIDKFWKGLSPWLNSRAPRKA